MNLSQDLISKFVEVTNQKKTESQGKNVYGTIVESDGEVLVRLDGAELLTPISGVVDAKNGDRVLVSLADHSAVVLGNFTYKPSARDTAKAQTTADEALASASEAQDEAQLARQEAHDAYEDSQNAQQVANEAVDAANVATQSATEATEKANEVESKVGTIEQNIESMNTDLDEINAVVDGVQVSVQEVDQKATQAGEAASQAQVKADEAKEALSVTQATADEAISKAETAQQTATKAQEDVSKVQGTVDAINGEVESAMQEIQGLADGLDTLSNTMSADYAKKTELTEVSADLETQISQNAAQIESTAKRVTTIDETVSNVAEQAAQAQQSANNAKAQADAASEEAQAAQTKANEAATAASNAQSEADTAKQAATAAQSKADKAAQDLATAEQNLSDVTLRVGATEEEIEEAKTAVVTAQQAADKAKTDAVEAAQKAQAAQDVADTASTNASLAQQAANNAVSKAEEAQEIADIAQGHAQAAIDKANEAADTAANAQTTANTAKENATEAQNKATAAATAASNAQKAADDADAKAAQAMQDLATAEQNLANVTSRVGATEEEIEEAKAEVAKAQTAASNAQADAVAAQALADSAKTNAANAQEAANVAKNAADAAQADADAAKLAADEAQADVDALAVRVETAETNISQNAEAIELRATKDEVTQTLGRYYTKVETDAAIVAKANEIISRVSSTETDLNKLTARVKTAESKITDSAIVTTVRSSSGYADDLAGKVGTNEIISRINQSAEAVTIDASKINLNGAVTISSFDEALTKALSSVPKKINTHLRNFTAANWETYGAEGHSEHWTAGSTYDNSHINVGDTAYILGTCSNAGGNNTVNVTLYGTVTEKTSTGIRMNTLYYTMSGEVGAYSLANSAKSAITAWCYNNNLTYIDGAKIYTGTITADKINVNDLFAQDITATGTIRGVSLIGASGEFSGCISADSGRIGKFDISNGRIGLMTTNEEHDEFIYLTSTIVAIDGDESGETPGTELGEYRTFLSPSGMDLYYFGQDGDRTYFARIKPDHIEIEAGDNRSYFGADHVSIDGDLDVLGVTTVSSLTGTGKIMTNASIYTGGKTATSDGNTGAVLSNTGRLHLQNTSDNPYIYFYGNGDTSYAARIGYSISDDIIKFAAATKYEFDNKVSTTASFYAGGKTSSTDGKDGALLGATGKLFLQYSEGNPYVGFYKGGSTSYDAYVSYDTTEDELRLGGAPVVRMQSKVVVEEILRVNGKIYMPYNTGELRGLKNGADTATTDNSNILCFIGESDNGDDGVSKNRAVFGAVSNSGSTEIRSPSAVFIKCNGRISETNTGYVLQFARLNFGTSSSPSYYGCLRPKASGATYLGSGTYPYKGIYATSGTVSTSDRNKKHDIVAIDDRDIQLFDMLLPSSYYFNDGDRRHFGFVAQDVEDAMNHLGFTSVDFAGLCKDYRKKYLEELEDDVFVLDENGNPIVDYSLRYQEFIALNTAKIKWLEKKYDNEFELTTAQISQLYYQMAQLFDIVAKQQQIINSFMAA